MTEKKCEAPLVPAQVEPRAAQAVTAERIERAKRTVARMMVKHHMPQPCRLDWR
jgi:hypothetical protein